MHPWFTLVNLERNTLGEPAQDPDGIRSMVVEELDAEIIRHMRWLFAPGPSHSDPEAREVFDEDALLSEIQEKMTNSEENMEKLFYRLLSQHKTDLLENYSGDDSDTVPGKSLLNLFCLRFVNIISANSYHKATATCLVSFRRSPETSRFVPQLDYRKPSIRHT